MASFIARSLVITALIIFVVTIGAARPASAGYQCSSGASVRAEQYCPHFLKFVKHTNKFDPRVASRVKANSASQTRSIALVIGNSLYPNLGISNHLPPAAVDVANLVAFFDKDQNFDEVILLENGQATRENIDYYLQDYLPQQGMEYTQKGRLVLAYTGHGLSSTATGTSALLLSKAANITDPAALFTLADIRTRLENLSKNYFHVLALINACYGGGVFGQGASGGNASTSEQPGSYALTAGPDDKVVASLGRPGDGSIFFDAIINGIRAGIVDLDYARLVAVDGTILQEGGITRLGALATYLDTEIETVNRRKIRTQDCVLKLGKPWLGPIQADGQVARGGFFFLSPIKLAPGLSQPIDVPVGPVSSIPGRPDIKVFKASSEYTIRGVDVSQYEGEIDWDLVAKQAGVRFAYSRAISWGGPDPSFSGHWEAIRRAGLRRGAMVVYNFCRSPSEQIADLVSIVKKEDAALPIGVTFITPPPTLNRKQHQCFKVAGLDKTRRDIIDFMEQVNAHYGKIPLLYGNRYNLGVLLTSDFNRFMIWFSLYGSSAKSANRDVGLVGSNPWTLWQYSAFETVSGIGKNVNVNLFFGSEVEFDQFATGDFNVALGKQ